MKKAFFVSTASTALFSLGAVGGAAAQEGDGGAASDAVRDEIVVTAGKTGVVNLQDVPASITAVSGDKMEDLDLRNVEDIAARTPGLEFGSYAGRQITTIRGIGTNLIQRQGDPSVTMQVDGVYIGRTAAHQTDLVDVERVEVLRGPQGTLYGRNAAAGTINVVTREIPKDEIDGKIQLMGGTYGAARGNLLVGGPVTDNLGISVAALYSRRDGYIENVVPGRKDLDSEDRHAVRVKMDYRATDRWNIKLSADYSRSKDDGGVSPVAITPTPFGATQQFDTFRMTANDEEQQIRIIDWGVSLANEFDVSDSVLLKSITAYRKFDFAYSTDIDASELPLFYQNPAWDVTEQVSQEVFLNGNSEKLDWVAGYFFYQESGPAGSDLWIRFAGVNRSDRREITTTSHAVYGQFDWHINDQWTATVGGRYTWDKKDTVNFDWLRPIDPTEGINTTTSVVPPIPGSEGTFGGKGEWSAFTPKFSLSYSPDDDTLLYVSASKGYKVGGTNVDLAPGETEPRPWDEETVWSYELGLKKSLFDNAATLNMSGFYMDYKNIQVVQSPVVDPNQPSSGFFALNLNAPGAEVFGAEMELDARLFDALDVSAGVSYLDATYDGTVIVEDATTGAILDGDGKVLENAPKWTASLAATYTWELRNGGALGVGVDGSYKTEVYHSVSNNLLEYQGAYGLLNARLFFNSPDDKWTLSVHGKNLTDTEHLDRAIFVAGNVVGTVAAPRTVIGSIEYRF